MDAGMTLGGGVYSSRLAARLANITTRKLRYWGGQGLVRPSVFDAPRGGQDLYSYTDLVQIRAVAELRRQGASLQKVRKAIEWLREQMADGEDWHTKTLRTDGRDVFAFVGPGDVYSAANQPGQRVFDVVLGDLEQGLSDVGRELGIGTRVTIDPGVQGGTPVVRNTRLPTSFIDSLLRDGYLPEELVAQYPGLTIEDVRAAEAFERNIRAA
ncbi:MAG: DUF433 domain-containing protein [Chloroflexota bacterium]